MLANTCADSSCIGTHNMTNRLTGTAVKKHICNRYVIKLYWQKQNTHIHLYWKDHLFLFLHYSCDLILIITMTVPCPTFQVICHCCACSHAWPNHNCLSFFIWEERICGAVFSFWGSKSHHAERESGFAEEYKNRIYHVLRGLWTLIALINNILNTIIKVFFVIAEI